jgi:hypothetical protein
MVGRTYIKWLLGYPIALFPWDLCLYDVLPETKERKYLEVAREMRAFP